MMVADSRRKGYSFTVLDAEQPPTRRSRRQHRLGERLLVLGQDADRLDRLIVVHEVDLQVSASAEAILDPVAAERRCGGRQDQRRPGLGGVESGLHGNRIIARGGRFDARPGLGL